MDQYVDELVEKYFRDAGWDTSKQNETKQNRSITSYDEHLLAGDAALQDGDLEAAEQHFASALKQVHDRDSPRLREEEKCLRKLGTVYVRRGVQTKDGQDFAKATALYNAALARGGNKHVLVDAIKKAERLFLSHTVGVDREPSLYDTDIEHKKRLEKYRAEVKVRLETIHNNFNPYQYDEDDPIVKEVEIKRAESVRDLFKDISKQRKDFIKDLVNECIETIGPPPCQYAMVGLGSQATELVTPYSDLEFAILIEENKDTPENKEYFLNLTCYLYLKIINLGETILPAVAIKSLNDFYSWQATEDSAESPTDGRAQGPTKDTAESLSEIPGKGPTEGSAEGSAESPTKDPAESPTKDPAESPTKDPAESPTKDPAESATKDPAEIPTKSPAEGLTQIRGEIQAGGPTEDPADGAIEGPTEKPVDDPADSWFYDSVTPRGFAFDGAMPWASKTPFGRERTKMKPAVSLIQTPSGLAEFQQHDIALAHGYHLSSIMRYVSFLTGDQTLVEDYVTWVRHGLEKEDTGRTHDIFLGTSGRLVNRKFAVASLSQITEDNLDQELTDRPLDVKKEIYRFPAVAVINLGLLIGVYAASVWDVIEEMEEDDHITKENAHHLKVLVSISGELRLRTYMELGAQKENLSGLLAVRKHPNDCEETFIKSVFYVPDQKMLFRYYYTARPLRKYIIDIINPLFPAPFLWFRTYKENTFYDASPSVKADICGGVLQFNAAIAHVEASLRELDEDQDTETSQRGQTQKLRSKAYLLDQRAATYIRLGDHRKAISCLEEKLRVQQQLYGDDPMHKAFISTHTRLVEAWGNLGEKEMAITYGKQMLMSLVDKGGVVPEIEAAVLDLAEKDVIAPDDHDVVMLTSFFEKTIKMLKTTHREDSAHQLFPHLAKRIYGLGDYTKAIPYTEESLRIMRTMYGQDTAHPDIAESLANLGHSLCVSRNDHVKAASYYEEALEMNKLVYGSDTPHPATADILNKLGVEWEHIGDDQKAISCYEQALQMLTAIHGEDNARHSSNAKILYSLGRLWFNVGDNEKARAFWEQALRMYQELYGPTTPHHDTALALNNMGAACGKSGDNFKEISFCKESLKMLEEVLGERTNHPDIAMVLGNLGSAFHDAGEYTKSIQYFERALEINKGIHGEGAAHPSIAKSLSNLAAVYRVLGDHTKAAHLYEDALDMTKAIHGANETRGGEEARHPDIADILNDLGCLWDDVGDNEKARAFWEQALKMYQEVYGPTTPHRATAVVLTNMGSAYLKAGENQKSLQYCERAVEMIEGLRGEDSGQPVIVKSLCQLALLYKEHGNYTKAAQLYEDALNMTKVIHGANETRGGDEVCHPDIAGILNDLGCLWDDVGDTEKARAFWEQALKMYQEVYGPTTPHRDTAIALNNMGEAVRKSGDYIKAISIYEEALKMTEEVFGESTEHPDIVCVLGNLGLTFHKAGELTKSIQYCERALKMIEGIHGEDAADPVITEALRDIAAVYEDLEDYTKAIQLYEDALDRVKTFHGANKTHPDILKLLNNLETVCNKAGDQEKANGYHDQAQALKAAVEGLEEDNDVMQP